MSEMRGRQRSDALGVVRPRRISGSAWRKLARSELVQDILSKVITAVIVALVAKLMDSMSRRPAEQRRTDRLCRGDSARRLGPNQPRQYGLRCSRTSLTRPR